MGIRQLKTSQREGVCEMNSQQLARLTDNDQWFRYWMPYQLAKLESSRHKHIYLPVNRNYKPLGYVGDNWVDYARHENSAIVFRADPHTFKDVWRNAEYLVLYDDSIDSRRDYFDRLGRLLSHAAAIVEPEQTTA